LVAQRRVAARNTPRNGITLLEGLPRHGKCVEPMMIERWNDASSAKLVRRFVIAASRDTLTPSSLEHELEHELEHAHELALASRAGLKI